jgi:hypothetical protein
VIALVLALSIRLAPNPPSLDVFGSGPFTNIGGGDEQAWTNAVAHVWFGSMCPLAGYYVDGRRGLRIAAASCAGLVLLRETFFHGRTPGPEVRTDLVTGLLPPVALLAFDLILSR